MSGVLRRHEQAHRRTPSALFESSRHQSKAGNVYTEESDSRNRTERSARHDVVGHQRKEQVCRNRERSRHVDDPLWAEPVGQRYEVECGRGVPCKICRKERPGAGVIEAKLGLDKRERRYVAGDRQQDDEQRERKEEEPNEAMSFRPTQRGQALRFACQGVCVLSPVSTRRELYGPSRLPKVL